MKCLIPLFILMVVAASFHFSKFEDHRLQPLMSRRLYQFKEIQNRLIDPLSQSTFTASSDHYFHSSRVLSVLATVHSFSFFKIQKTRTKTNFNKTCLYRRNSICLPNFVYKSCTFSDPPGPI